MYSDHDANLCATGQGASVDGADAAAGVGFETRVIGGSADKGGDGERRTSGDGGEGERDGSGDIRGVGVGVLERILGDEKRLMRALFVCPVAGGVRMPGLCGVIGRLRPFNEVVRAPGRHEAAVSRASTSNGLDAAVFVAAAVILRVDTFE
jgi:hypothetical protein